jgi:hypothetical protein
MKNKEQGDLVIYQGKNGEVELRTDIKKNTIWATQAQIAGVFGINRTVVTKHINKILDDGEVIGKSNVQKMHIANSDKPIAVYSLDIILAVGYRTSSQQAILFRKWATNVLHEYLAQGHALNRYKLGKSPEALVGLYDAVSLIESEDIPGKLKGKITIKLAKEFIPAIDNH